jgi:hypothetical protein
VVNKALATTRKAMVDSSSRPMTILATPSIEPLLHMDNLIPRRTQQAKRFIGVVILVVNAGVITRLKITRSGERR